MASAQPELRFPSQLQSISTLSQVGQIPEYIALVAEARERDSIPTLDSAVGESRTGTFSAV